MRRLVIALALLTMWVATPAQARMAEAHDIRRDLAIGHAYFPTACSPNVITDESITDIDDHDAQKLGLAYTSGDPCTIWVTPEYRDILTARELCMVIVHETGHLAGHEHSLNPDSVMYAYPEHIPKLCIAAYPRPAARCTEDSPCWTWSRMGNRRRGAVVTRGGNVRVVGPCAFAHLAADDAIDWSSTPRMKGDTWAQVHGCQEAHEQAWS